MNNVSLVGRLTKEVDLKFTGNGTAVGSFDLAVNRNFTNQQGEREVDFIRCVIWRKSAENLANFTRKGSLIGIEGRIQTRSYDDNNGQKKYITEVVANNFHLLEPKSVTEQRPQGQGGQNFGNNNQYNYQGQQNWNQTQGGYPTQPNNFNNQQHNNNAANWVPQGSQPVNITEDDLPF